MNPFDQSLWRLFNAAATAPKPRSEPAPFGLETRVLAQWRAMRAEDEFPLLMTLFRRAMVCAGLVMIFSICWNARENTTAAATAVALASYEINTHLPP